MTPRNESSLNKERGIIATAASKVKETLVETFETNKNKVAAVAVGTAALVAAGCGVQGGEVSATPHSSDTQSEQPADPTTSSSPETSPTVKADKYGPAGAESEAFIKSLEISATGDATAVGKKIIEDLNTWNNIGTNEDAFNAYVSDADPNASLDDFALEYTSSWANEFSTIFDESSDSYQEIMADFRKIPASVMGAYLATVHNGNANTVYTTSQTFTSAEEVDVKDSEDFRVKVTYVSKDNAGDTGVVNDTDGGNTERTDILYFGLKQYGDVYKIVDVSTKG